MGIHEKLANIQAQLKAPKSQWNPFGKYHYRSCEDILEAAKPLCAETKTILLLTDEVVQIGERHYVKATATLLDVENPSETISVTAYAREEETKSHPVRVRGLKPNRHKSRRTDLRRTPCGCVH